MTLRVLTLKPARLRLWLRLRAALLRRVGPAAVRTAVLLMAGLVVAVFLIAGVQPRVPVEASPSRWLPPIDVPLQVTGPFRAPPSPYMSGHRGIDLPATPGTSVAAPVSGVVGFAGRVVDRGVLSIRVDERTVVSFEPIDMSVSGLSAGDEVERGQVLGVMAEGGHCVNECVHLGVRIDDAYVNPMRFFAGKPVLLPW